MKRRVVLFVFVLSIMFLVASCASNKTKEVEVVEIAEEPVIEPIKAEIIDKREGSEWYAEVSYDHKPHDWKEIVGPWKCPYHNGRMCMEVINRGVDF